MRADLRTPFAVVPVLIALVVAGCGQTQSKAETAYITATDRVVRAFDAEFQALQARFTPVSTPSQDIRTLGRLRAAVDRVVANLQEVNAPASIASLHSRLVQRVRAYCAVIQTAQNGFASPDRQAIIAARTRFSRTLAATAMQITDTIDTINQKAR